MYLHETSNTDETNKKINTVISKNTFYFFDNEFEQEFESYIYSIHQLLLVLKNKIETSANKSVTKEMISDFLSENPENGLKALLTLTGFSNEYFKRLITLIRIVNDEELSNLTKKNEWCSKEDSEKIHEWTDEKIINLIKNNSNFREGITNIFFQGSTVTFLRKTLPLFELKKLNISKLNFDISAILDTLVRYREKGSRSGKADNNPEKKIASILSALKVDYETGDLDVLAKEFPNQKRTMDFIIPNKKNPVIIIECSYLTTTSSGQGDKSKTENSIRALIKKIYPNAKFIGFVDGIGWYVRKKDLERMVSAYDDVFTFHNDELNRFTELINAKMQAEFH